MAVLLNFNGVDITDQGRTFSESTDLRKNDIELSSGNLKRYLKAAKRRFSISWTWCPQSSSLTYDLMGGRDTIRNIVYGGAAIAVIIRNHPTLSAETYTMFVDSYSENLLRRDNNLSIGHYWDISLELVEV